MSPPRVEWERWQRLRVPVDDGPQVYLIARHRGFEVVGWALWAEPDWARCELPRTQIVARVVTSGHIMTLLNL